MKNLFGTATYDTNIPRFLITRALSNAMFFLPIWVIFVQQKHGIDLVQVTLLDSAFWLTMALTEIPTGAVADTVGRKHSYAIGTALSGFGLLLFALSPTYPLLLIGNSLWALALTFISGADLAFFYDSLRELGRTDEYPRFRSIISAVDIIAAGLSGVLGGLLYRWLPEAPFVFYFFMLVPMFALILTFREPTMESPAEAGHKTTYREILKQAAQLLRQKPILRNVLMYSNLLPVAGVAIGVTLIQPHVVNIGLPLESLGVIVFGISLVRIIGAGSATRLSARLGEWRLLVAAPLLVVIGVVGIGYFSNIAGLFIFGFAVFSSAASRPTIENILMKETPDKIRATILSADSLIFRLLLAAISPFVGVVAESTSLPTAFIVLGAGVGLLLWLNLVIWGRARQAVPISSIVNKRSFD